MECDLLIKHGAIVARPGRCDLISSGFIAIKQGHICAVGPMAEAPGITAAQEIDANGCLVMPGLVNGHCHGAMTLFRGLADDLPLLRWLEEHIFPAEARYVNEEMVYWASKLAAAEMLLGGTCLVADSYFCMDGAARAYEESGLRAVAAHGVIDFPAPGIADPQNNLVTATDYCRKWQGRPLVTPAIFAHSPYTCSAQTLQAAHHAARELGVDLYIHLAETATERELLPVKGQSPAAYLDSLAILDENVVVVHGVWLDETDMDILARRGCRMVSCPESNMKLASGVAPLAAVAGRGIPLGLGTDGAASNNNLDMFAEMGMAARLAKVATLEPELLPASQVLAMATWQGEQVLGQPGKGLVTGGRADLIVIDLAHANLTPFYNSDILVYGGQAHNVRDVVVAGRVVVRQRKIVTMDIEEVMATVREMAAKVKGND